MGHAAAILGHFTEYAQHYGYVGIFLWFMVIDEVIPLPDELPLVTIGYLCATGVFHHPILAAAVAFTPFMLIDIAFYIIAWNGSSFAERIERRLKATWLTRYKNNIRDNLPQTLFILAFIPRMRAFAPLIAGTVRVPPRRFFIYNTLSLALFIVVYISLGYYFHDQVLSIFTKIEHHKHILFGVFLLILLAILLYISNRYRRKNAPVFGV